MDNKVFFGTEGLTQTSANHVANLAKEYIEDITAKLENVRFFDTTVSLMGATIKQMVSQGCTTDTLTSIPAMLKEVSKAKSLIAWLREAIKAKDQMYNSLMCYRMSDWAIEKGIELPTEPIAGNALTEAEYWDSRSIKERNTYYSLETEVAVVGKYIHPNGAFANARKNLNEACQNPCKVNGTGRDAIIYENRPTCTVENVDKLFFALQKTHREKQASLNALKHACEEAIRKSEIEVTNKYHNELGVYRAELNKLSSEFSRYKTERNEEISKLRIVIPDALKDIYNKISNLGKSN